MAQGEYASRLQDLVVDTPLTVEPTEHFERSAWVKLGINSVVNGLTALTSKPSGVLRQPGIGAIAEALLRECWETGVAAGVDLDLDGVASLVDRIGSNAQGRTSMQHDRDAGRPTEHDAIHGAVLRKAAELQVSVPTTQLIHDLLAASSPDIVV